MTFLCEYNYKFYIAGYYKISSRNNLNWNARSSYINDACITFYGSLRWQFIIYRFYVNVNTTSFLIPLQWVNYYFLQCNCDKDRTSFCHNYYYMNCGLIDLELHRESVCAIYRFEGWLEPFQVSRRIRLLNASEIVLGRPDVPYVSESFKKFVITILLCLISLAMTSWDKFCLWLSKILSRSTIVQVLPLTIF